MKKSVSLLLVAALLLGLLAGCAAKSGEEVSVQAVSLILGHGVLGLNDRFAGIVEAGRTVGVEKDEALTVKELLVAAGDTVAEGDVLFTYDTEALALELEKRQLEIEQSENGVTTKTAQIEELEKEKARASADAQIDYTLQIQALQLEISETTLELEAKRREITRLEQMTEHAEVRAELGGRVLSVNDPQSESYDATKPYLTLAQTDSYRVKGTVNEQYAYSLQVGTPMLVRSRSDETQVWHGSIEAVDLENPVRDNSGYYYGGNEMTTSSKYPFYVTVEDDTGLMLGQHVYLEADYGQSDGLYLPASWLCDPNGAAWVWAAGSNDRLEKRSVTLGAYDADNDAWEIVSGLSLTDYLAFPDAHCAEGAAVVYYSEDSFRSGEDETGAIYGGEDHDDGGAYFDNGEAGVIDDGAYFYGEDGAVEGTVPETDGAYGNGGGVG